MELLCQQQLPLSPYQKEETIKNSDINYQQTSNLENLIRNKRKSASGYGYDGFYLFPNTKIKLLGEEKTYRGQVYIDIQNKRIKFYSIDQEFDSNNPHALFKEIVIRNRANKVIKNINIFGQNSMWDVLKNHNLQCGNCQNYEIEVWSAVANTTLFVKNDNPDKSFVWNTSEGNWREKFTIINDQIWEINVYMQKYFSLLLEWKNNYESWKNEVNRQYREDYPYYSYAQRRSWKGDKINEEIDKIHSLNQNIEIIKNSQHIRELSNRISNLENNFVNLKDELKTIKNELNKIKNGSSKKLSRCSTGSTVVGKIVKVIPVFGEIIEYITGLISTGCNIASSI